MCINTSVSMEEYELGAGQSAIGVDWCEADAWMERMLTNALDEYVNEHPEPDGDEWLQWRDNAQEYIIDTFEGLVQSVEYAGVVKDNFHPGDYLAGHVYAADFGSADADRAIEDEFGQDYGIWDFGPGELQAVADTLDDVGDASGIVTLGDLKAALGKIER
ncbi:hypothetical protein [Olsenella uli]|uniref:hypothetical protein n=1 Tax=Olsenella uli TaxID=133926 RepID=UPI00241D47A6|nr:hypothetical protein [Olsenella uli]